MEDMFRGEKKEKPVVKAESRIVHKNENLSLAKNDWKICVDFLEDSFILVVVK